MQKKLQPVVGCYTQEVISGKTVLLGQGVYPPRAMREADLRGNYKCEGRRVVALTPDCLFSALHMRAESLEAENLPITLKKHRAAVHAILGLTCAQMATKNHNSF